MPFNILSIYSSSVKLFVLNNLLKNSAPSIVFISLTVMPRVMYHIPKTLPNNNNVVNDVSTETVLINATVKHR